MTIASCDRDVRELIESTAFKKRGGQIMTLYELWENVNIDQHLIYEELNDDDTVSLKEYEGDDRCRKGADEVYGISADYLAGIGYVIVAHML